MVYNENLLAKHLLNETKIEYILKYNDYYLVPVKPIKQYSDSETIREFTLSHIPEFHSKYFYDKKGSNIVLKGNSSYIEK